ncbi:zinc ribbon domain-containing protein [Nostoc sp. LPT]|uniref:zinc ribbon domain-containing protein n=1 Tax=Nostoc sp. LPT TaxID=2815387 RepID=UPI001DC1B191|nr:transposase [Nostoc sp. LPT]
MITVLLLPNFVRSIGLCKRQYDCNVCNLSINRDLNASINLLNYARISSIVQV